MLTLVYQAPLYAGAVFEMEHKKSVNGAWQSDTNEALIEGKNMKMVTNSANGRETMIYRGDRRVMLIVDHDSHSFSQIDKQAVAGVSRQMQAQLAKLPSAQRAMMEKMMRRRTTGTPAPQSVVKRTSNMETINGFDAAKYEVYRGGAKVRDVWTTAWDRLKIEEDVQAVFEDMSRFFDEVFAEMGRNMPFSAGMMRNPYRDLAQMNGFPVKTVYYKNGRVTRATVLKAVRERNVAATEFEPPAGYRKRTFGGGAQ